MNLSVYCSIHFEVWVVYCSMDGLVRRSVSLAVVGSASLMVGCIDVHAEADSIVEDCPRNFVYCSMNLTVCVVRCMMDGAVRGPMNFAVGGTVSLLVGCID